MEAGVRRIRRSRIGGLLRAYLTEPLIGSRFGSSRVVALGLEVALKVIAPDLYVAPELYGGYLPALYTLVDPRFAHPQLLADIRDREEFRASSCLSSSWLALGALRPLLSAYEGLFEPSKGVLQLF
jgi:hypothetical protein